MGHCRLGAMAVVATVVIADLIVAESEAGGMYRACAASVLTRLAGCG